MIANMLQTRKNRVIFVTPTTSYDIILTRDEALSGIEIEEKIVADIVCFSFNCIFSFKVPKNICFEIVCVLIDVKMNSVYFIKILQVQKHEEYIIAVSPQ